jgi:N-acetylglutamate synthase-like GNAT family acetyltransferase
LNITFNSYSTANKAACLALFDANCPEFFSPRERSDYETFLAGKPTQYELCFNAKQIVGAFGLMGDGASRRDLNWILLDPASQGLGIGSAIMERVIHGARAAGLEVVNIAASHKSEAFFAIFGAHEVERTENGWGPGMHRVDMKLPV